MKRVLVLGAGGLLGSSLCPALERAGLRVLRHGRSDGAQFSADLRDPTSARALIASVTPDVVVNLVAETDVDRCQREPAAARALNVEVVENLAAGLHESRIHLVHVSTDQVYSGPGPHHESSTSPVNEYGRSKLAGERVAEAAGATILRTNFVGRSRALDRRSFSDWVVSSFRSGRAFTLFDDVRFSPLHMEQLAAAVQQVIETPRSGVFNVGCRGGISKAEFGFRLARLLGLESPNARRGRSVDKRLTAPRPTDMTMDSQQFETTFDQRVPSIDATLDRTAKEYADEQ